ncbi:class I SAM-dependent methyltransferase [Rufibacter immobilis]|uniref:Class I SAM-dependent methyltransferase n=1 Tax=Rufibacter immobilis TaxID=1348778 RepID=A0A3M9MY90_9BACT|nr:class I SAM-dependent methyltransferase [Rufibacter immobilis]RNI29728.1 class I SAM-dependent methyltransferase [Rufibacter immobilis]
MKKGQISNLLRRFGLMYLTDWVRFYMQAYQNRKSNQEFKKAYPQIPLPPDYLIYESFQIDYQKYYFGGQETAKWLTDHLQRHVDLSDKKILDWGCGPGRIIRHLPEIMNHICEFFGTDYNKKSIEWCTRHLPGIHFNHNSLSAQLPYQNHFFDVIYGISIFTHLSEPLHHEWFAELYRVLKPGGILFLTTQGNNFKSKLTQPELANFEAGKLVVRGQVKEGHRTFSAFQPAGFMHRLFAPAEILEHLEPLPQPGKGIPQDIWIIKKQ